MGKLASILGVATLATSLALGSLTPAGAAPIVPNTAADRGVINVQLGTTDNPTLAARGDRWRYRNLDDGNAPIYRGYRGVRHYRHGHRRHNGWWYPAGAFVAGAIIGSAMSGPRYYEPPRRYYRGDASAHVRWCYDRYRSYREWDNTYQPYNGPRRECFSPYSY